MTRGLFKVTYFFLYPFLFASSTVLLGLTAYRIHYTESLSSPDVLTTRTHFYDPRIAALMVASILGLVFSLAMIGVAAATNYETSGFEIGAVWVLWIFFLITAALVTRQFNNLKWCRSHKVCSVLETIKAFSWICWGFLSIIAIVALVNFFNRAPRTNQYETRQRSATGATTGTTGATTGATGVSQPQGVMAQDGPTGRPLTGTQNTSTTKEIPAGHVAV